VPDPGLMAVPAPGTFATPIREDEVERIAINPEANGIVDGQHRYRVTDIEANQRVYQAPVMTWVEHQERARQVRQAGEGLGWGGRNNRARPFQGVADRVRANNAVHERRKKKRFRTIAFRYNKKTILNFSTEYFEDHKSFLKMMYSGRLPIKGVTHAFIIKSLYSLNSRKKINVLLKDISRKTYNKYVASYYKNIGR